MMILLNGVVTYTWRKVLSSFWFQLTVIPSQKVQAGTQADTRPTQTVKGKERNHTRKHTRNIHTHKEIDTQMCTHMCTPHIHMHTQGHIYPTSLLVCFPLGLPLCSSGTPDWGTVPSTTGQVYWHPKIKDKFLRDMHTAHLELNNLFLTLFLNDSRMC